MYTYINLQIVYIFLTIARTEPVLINLLEDSNQGRNHPLARDCKIVGAFIPFVPPPSPPSFSSVSDELQ